MAALRSRLNDFERQHPALFAWGLILALDAGLILSTHYAAAFA